MRDTGEKHDIIINHGEFFTWRYRETRAILQQRQEIAPQEILLSCCADFSYKHRPHLLHLDDKCVLTKRKDPRRNVTDHIKSDLPRGFRICANRYSTVMIPVSSTVIPLPVYKVGYGLGFISKDKKTQSSKPEGGIKLITISKIQEKI
ncbi:PREDICTED: uncharacterized protein LOC105563704 isoform X1 [Vollenhovia emeryi]|uniref:uncharacterized protein LOC105563704 isoform X1 n=1 Tax=Vollenhovia emeryi TaxID=411798 RepID=UPI0005F4F16D|nr:PREDICTED: uncharacterized protein LOC105563704 isoform X1 [Vollenhovia emeryi]XP_011870913.1 PREDICTED: uncharacterized protein LOC105563704 isoform X1 [Vollenhovia emeryi]XP_011870914.1 PREDICTED: uncharacterized protein LOC105563704 isoform X1 [Vollenhovia emeryi]XP_011870915.1 PREDICTED: uncharacterized protein LOC105563704 isoform X1 [Vollenhovia emeryi]XP_011870916.1 PREDICTED: uncharacterized protein LOC105563704 isoform X1 [Vollenhovia emeryi]XP_011870917.1 PREDICTED: uncharacterize